MPAIKADEQYWLRQLRHHATGHSLAALYKPGGQEMADESQTITVYADASLMVDISHRCNGNKVNLQVYCLTAFQWLLSRYTSSAETLLTYQCDAGPVFLPGTIAWNASFRDVFLRNHEAVTMATAHGQYDFKQLCEAIERNTEHTTTSLHTAAFLMNVHLPEQDWTADYPLKLLLHTDADKPSISLQYDAGRITEQVANHLLQNYGHLLRVVTDQPGIAVQEIDWAFGMEGYATHFPAQVNHPQQLTLVDLFEEQVSKTPDRIAVQYAGESLTYKVLNEKANRVAHYLVQQTGSLTGKQAGLLVVRSCDMIVGLLGILKAGAAYVPIDPAYPPERIRYILEDTGLQMLVTDLAGHHLVQQLDNYTGQTIVLQATPSSLPVHNLPVLSSPADLAYIIYTSGSTGHPKGVMIAHRNVVRLLRCDDFLFHFDEQDTWTLFHSINFDFSVWEIWGALSTGARLLIVPEETTRDMAAWAALLIREKATVVNQVPTVFSMVQKELLAYTKDVLPALRYIIFGGEALEYSTLAAWAHAFPAVRCINMYGITETTVHVTYKEITAADIQAGLSNIGRPIPTLTVRVMDAAGKPLPAGITGELVVGGAGVARGYLNKPDQTTLAFVPDTISVGAPAGQCMYRSGDTGRMLPNGELLYEGRKDQQVKIRGFRIETGEVAHAIAQYPGVQEVKVIAVTVLQEKALVAYLMLTPDTDSGLIRQFAKTQLPAHMVPAYFVPVSKWPVTANGKLDISRLPDPLFAYKKETDLTALTPVQQVLCSIWESVLMTPVADIDSDFFEMGGHSLLANRICAAIQKELHCKLNPAVLFLHPTIRQLAVIVQDMEATEVQPIRLLHTQASYETSYAQRRLWFIQQLQAEKYIYNIPCTYRIDGFIDQQAFGKALAKLVARHEVLRTTFVMQGEALMQQVKDHEEATPDYIDISDQPDTVQQVRSLAREEAMFVFDLARGPLYRMKLIRTAPASFVVLFTLHHIIADGWSVEILVDDFLAYYEEAVAGHPAALSVLPFQYKEVAAWHNRQVDQTRDKSRPFWQKMLGTYTPLPLLYPDHPANRVTQEGALVEFDIDASITTGLKAIARNRNTTLFSVLAATINILLSRQSGSKDIVIGYPVAGREYPGTDRLCGLFVNTIALRTRLGANDTFDALLTRIGDTLAEIEKYQQYPFDQVVDDLRLKRDARRNPLFDVGFTWHASHLARRKGHGTLVIQELRFEWDSAKADWWFHGMEVGDHIIMSLQYNTGLFKQGTIQLATEKFKWLLQQISTDAHQYIADLQTQIRYEGIAHENNPGIAFNF